MYKRTDPKTLPTLKGQGVLVQSDEFEAFIVTADLSPLCRFIGTMEGTMQHEFAERPLCRGWRFLGGSWID